MNKSLRRDAENAQDSIHQLIMEIEDLETKINDYELKISNLEREIDDLKYQQTQN